ncbi:cysteine protease StiP family protein [Viridibacillus sp. YIM B01967]|uniref:Cysteine protease StiP family protein n=1 Tax=Viridibacillus soli TaxID=2798301 RepID=A0ABS1H279_9BACL|nr:cysteine protease StiP family protein [Viridibacillus soli]MBK3493287.1 cysteine protease StiP family protein [Viridibacillus soli]
MIELINKPDMMGSYKADDAVFLLRDLSTLSLEISNEERERLIQSGTHYSEMLPIEYQPSEEYLALFHRTLADYAKRIAIAVGVVAEQIKLRKGLENLVLVSLARAGTPIGVLIKRYFKERYNVDVPHYSISIIRGRGLDETAIRYIFEQHPTAAIQFIDGWTGKGAITKELDKSCAHFNAQNKSQIESELAVLADPGHCVSLYGTREDFLIPSACLNSTVSGLVSRTVLNYSFMEKGDFHGAKYYKELQSSDVSNLYIEAVSDHFELVTEEVQEILTKRLLENTTPTWQGMKAVQAIQEEMHITDVNLVKPGVGETTRVLLRRIPWKILINPACIEDLEHVLLLAKDKNIPIEEYSNMSYSCCGLIKNV